MAVVLCTVCGTSEADVPALDVWTWFAEHAVQHPPAHGTPERYEDGCRCDPCERIWDRRTRARGPYRTVSA